MSIPGSASPLLLTSAAGAAGYEIERSLRFNSADSTYLSRTLTATGSSRKFTWSYWIKNLKASGTHAIWNTGGTTPWGGFYADGFWFKVAAGDIVLNGYGDPAFRDSSAWQHWVIAVDTEQATATDRFKVYVNGVYYQASGGLPSQNSNIGINTTGYSHRIGGSPYHIDAYLAEFRFIDGQQLSPTDFGEFDANNVWQPIAYSGSYGTNGFHLDFSDNSSASALGTDSSGNGNNFTVHNLSVTCGNGSYVTNTTGTPYSAGAAINAFDDDDTTYMLSNAANSFYGVTFSPGLTGTLRLYASRSTSTDGRLKVNGTEYTSSLPTGFASPSWVTISYPEASITSIEVDRYAPLRKVEVDGVVLVDNAAPANAGCDSLFDSPTNGTQTDTGAGGEVSGNYCTWNPLCVTTNNTLSNGNLEAAHTASTGWTGNPNGTNYAMFVGTMGVTSGKWYWEGTWTSSTTGAVGIVNVGTGLEYYVGYAAKSVGYTSTYVYNNGFGSAVGSMPSYAQGDIIGVAIDMDNGKLYFSKNGTFINSGDPAAGTGNVASGLQGETIFPAVSQLSSASGISFTANFGQRPFAYTAPSGFKALCTANFDTPTIEDPSTVMDAKLWTGNGTSQTITGYNFSPDFVWIKNRTATGALAEHHALFDQIRGATKVLYSSLPNSEPTQTNGLTSFTSDGFALGSDGKVNKNTDAIVGWAWDGGSSTVSNTDGSITSSVRANASAGFSIVSYTGNNTNGATVGHGLNVAPSWIIIKNRSVSYDWVVLYTDTSKKLYLNLTNSADSYTQTTRTSSVFTLENGTAVNGNGNDMIAYCWAPVEGYSAFGSYTGNLLNDGPFVYTGFRPKWVMIKRTDSTGNWVIWDAERSGYNAANDTLVAENSNPENAFVNNNELDILSNGFKIRITRAILNASNGNYIYAAFAETPQKFARAR